MRDKRHVARERRHRRTHRHPECVAMMAGADFDAAPSLAGAMGLEGPALFNLWVWEQPSWRVIATYPTSKEAHRAGHHSADPLDTWTVAKVGSQKDEHMRQHCTDRMAPYN